MTSQRIETPAAGPSGGVRMRRMRARDEDEVLALLEASFGGWPSLDVDGAAIDHLRWKLRPEPDGAAAHCVAEDDEGIVAVQLAALLPYRLDGRPLTGLRQWDGCVDRRARGRGVMSGLRAFTRDAATPPADLNMGAFTRNPAVLGIQRREGRLPLGVQLEARIAPLSARAAADALKLRWGRPPAKLVRALPAFARWLAAQRQAPHDDGCALRSVDAFDERIDGLCAEAERAFDFTLVRSRALLSWRYADPRGGRSRILQAEDGERLLGYAVVRPSGRRAFLADLLVLPGRLDVARALARDAQRAARAAGASEVACVLPANHPYQPALRAAGFVARRRRKTPFGYLPMHSSPEELSRLADPGLRVHMMLGDSDIV